MGFDLQLIGGICFGGALFALLLSSVSVRLSAILQQKGYKGADFLRWYLKKGNIQRKRISLLTLCLVLLSALFALTFSFLGAAWTNLVSLAPVVGIFLLYLSAEKNYALKVPARRTPRFLRLTVAHFILLAACSVGAGFGLAALSFAIGSEYFSALRFVPLCLLVLLLPFTLTCADFIMTLYEKPHTNAFIKRAKRTIAESGCVKVGITGSFGKTSVKRFAEQILSAKFRVIATPASYNTPVGIAKCVNEGGLDCDVFLAEMGARHTGDIAELCGLAEPDFGVVTGVCCQHLETFGSVEAIRAEKLVLRARAKRGCVLGSSVADARGENDLCEGDDFAAEDVSLSPEGVSFTLRLKGEKFPVATKLLGRHAAQDVALAAALCSLLGMSGEEIAAEIPKLEPVEHRLRLLKGRAAVLDDSYNSNVEGARDAVETLKLFPGKHFVVTPGLVELGMLEEEENAALGASFVGCEVLLVGETLVLPVQKGYLGAGGDPAHIRIVPTLGAAQEILGRELGSGDAVLFLNDLPDCYL